MLILVEMLCSIYGMSTEKVLEKVKTRCVMQLVLTESKVTLTYSSIRTIMHEWQLRGIASFYRHGLFNPRIFG